MNLNSLLLVILILGVIIYWFSIMKEYKKIRNLFESLKKTHDKLYTIVLEINQRVNDLENEDQKK